MPALAYEKECVYRARVRGIYVLDASCMKVNFFLHEPHVIAMPARRKAHARAFNSSDATGHRNAVVFVLLSKLHLGDIFGSDLHHFGHRRTTLSLFHFRPRTNTWYEAPT